MATNELLPPEALTALTRRRSDWRGLVQLGSHLLALALGATLVTLSMGSGWLWSALWLHGVVLSFLFAPAHECVHQTAFRSRWLNRLVGTLCGFVLVLPPRYFRAFHLAHHRHTQDPERDPELASPKPASLGAFLWHVSGVPYWWGQFATLWRFARGEIHEPFVTLRERPALIREARLFWLGYAVVAVVGFLGGGSALLHYWVIPALLGQPMLRLYLLAEHTGCPQVADMLTNTRTTLTMPWLRWLAWNMPYHVEHHAAAAVPFHALPALHGLIRERIAVLSPGYRVFHQEFLKTLLQGSSRT